MELGHEKSSEFSELFSWTKQKKKALKTQSLLAEEEGIEPPLTVLETAALPLYYSSI